MLRLLPVIAACVACSPTETSGEQAVAEPQPHFATQTTAPPPDYRALLRQVSLADESGRQARKTLQLPPSNAKQVGDEWIERVKKRGALLGYGLAGKSPDGAVRLIDTGLTQKEFNSWTKQNGWTVPAHIEWSFAPEMTLPRVSEAAKNAVRVWPASTARTGLQYMAGYSGRVELRDGCLFVGQFDDPPNKLAWFHAEMGLDVDSNGFFVLRDRVNGQTLARIGEKLSWAGPASADIDAQTKRALLDACGPAEILIVGSPQSSERFMTQYPHLRRPQTPLPPLASPPQSPPMSKISPTR